jgi:Ca-activated chloride channel family protein
MARALGWPRKAVSFDDIVKLAVAPDGWASVGKPQFGRFKYVHTNPDSSTSGAEAVTGSYDAVVNKREGLTDADVAAAGAKVKSLERAIVHSATRRCSSRTGCARAGSATRRRRRWRRRR